MAEMADENIVLEGFLCPICKVDFGVDLKLFLHFQEAHGEDQDLVKSFKGLIKTPSVHVETFNYHYCYLNLELFGKAKEKILKNDIVKKDERRHVWKPQEIGYFVNNNPLFYICPNY